MAIILKRATLTLKCAKPMPIVCPLTTRSLPQRTRTTSERYFTTPTSTISNTKVAAIHDNITTPTAPNHMTTTTNSTSPQKPHHPSVANLQLGYNTYRLLVPLPFIDNSKVFQSSTDNKTFTPVQFILDPNTPLAAIEEMVQEELRQTNIRKPNVEIREVSTGIHETQKPIKSLMHIPHTFKIGSLEVPINFSNVKGQINEFHEVLDGLQNELVNLDMRKHAVEKRANRWVNRIKLFGLFCIIGQLIVVGKLTYLLGWDLMGM